MKNKKTGVKKQKNYRMLLALIIALIILGIAIFKEPSITGRVIQSQQTAYSENLNIQKNESGAYEWQVKNPGSIKSLRVTGSVTSNGTARILIENNGTNYTIFDSTKQLFDVNVHVLPEYKKILQGGEVLLQITLINLRGFGAGDVDVTYSIKDSRGNVIASELEKVFVSTQAKFVRKLIIPDEIAPGTYTASVEGFTNVVVGTGSDSFEVAPKYEYKYPQELRNYLIGLAVLVALAIAFILGVHGASRLKKKKEITELKKKMPLERISKLEKELKALEEARKSGFISEESFQREKKRIEDKLGISKNR